MTAPGEGIPPDVADRVRSILRSARIVRDSLPPRDAALAAYTPGGMPVAEIEALIIRQRAAARAALQSAA